MRSLGNEVRKHINVLLIMLKETELSEPCEFKMYPFLKSMLAIFGIQLKNLDFQTPKKFNSGIFKAISSFHTTNTHKLQFYT